MPQINAWENEYKQMKMVTGNAKPQQDVLKYFKYLKKEKKFRLEDRTILDLGSGTGRNSNYLASLGNKVYGIELSKTAVAIAKERATKASLDTNFATGSFGEKLKFKDSCFDLVLDITSSNSLNEVERDTYLKEVYRVLKPGGYFFVRALAKEGDKNAKNLLKNSPGTEQDTYYMKDLDLYEKVFTQEGFKNRYAPFFEIEKVIKKTGYASISGRKFKRNYLLAYMTKK